MAQVLPRYAAFKSKNNNNFLRLVNESSEVQGFLQYSGESILSPYTKYQLEQAKGYPTLVHIRCCYNNKYWASHPSDPSYILARAEKTEEDKTKWNCTLFQPIYDSTHQAFRFRHVYRGFNVCLLRVGPPYGNCLYAQWSDPDRDLCDLNTVIDWGTLISLPKYVAFKGSNGSYLSATMIGGHQYLEFSSTDIGQPSVAMETFITNDGNIRLKSKYFGKFWRRSSNWIWADSTDTTTNNLDTLFWATKVDENIVALRNLGNNNFVKLYTYDGKIACLNAAVSSVDLFSRLEVHEPVLSREIYNVQFRALDARIYDESITAMATQSATNTTLGPNTMDLNLTYTDTKSSTWKSFVSVKLGVKTTIESGVPGIVNASVEISAEISGGYEWGETKETSRELQTTYQVTVPPRTTTTVTLIATRGKCDVPFSYTQRDTLHTGEVKTYQMDDGVFKGVNSYNFKYGSKDQPLGT